MSPIRLAAFAAALALLATSAIADPLALYAKPERLVRLADGREMNLICLGKGSPTIVLEAGWSSWSLDWAPIQASLAKTTRTCAYDRAGLGFSTPGSTVKTLASVVADEAEMLEKAGIAGPLVLVGHSKGAVFVRAFTAAHPDLVAGLVLVDPGSPERDDAFLALDPAAEAKAVTEIRASLARCVDRARAGVFTLNGPQDAFCIDDEGDPDWNPDLKAAYRALQHSVGFAETRLAEIEIANALPDSARVAGALGDRPLIVLRADQGLSHAIPEPRRSQLYAAEQMATADLARLSQRGEIRRVERSGHTIAHDRPDAVIDAVEAVVAASQRRAAQ